MRRVARVATRLLWCRRHEQKRDTQTTAKVEQIVTACGSFAGTHIIIIDKPSTILESNLKNGVHQFTSESHFDLMQVNTYSYDMSSAVQSITQTIETHITLLEFFMTTHRCHVALLRHTGLL